MSVCQLQTESSLCQAACVMTLHQCLLSAMRSPLLKSHPRLAQRIGQVMRRISSSGRLSVAFLPFTFIEGPSAYTLWLSTLPCWKGSMWQKGPSFAIIEKLANSSLPGHKSINTLTTVCEKDWSGEPHMQGWNPWHSYCQIINAA